MFYIFSFIKAPFRLNLKVYIWYNRSDKSKVIYYLEGPGEIYE